MEQGEWRGRGRERGKVGIERNREGRGRKRGKVGIERGRGGGEREREGRNREEGEGVRAKSHVQNNCVFIYAL